MSRRAEKYNLINSPWIRTVLSMTTSYINLFSLVIIDPENFRNDTPQLRYLQRRPRLSRTSDSRRGSTDTPDDYPTRPSTSASRVSYYRFSARGACPPRPPLALGREKNKQGIVCCRIAPAMASSSAPARKPLAELTEDEFLTDLVCFSTRTTRRMSFPSPRRLARASPPIRLVPSNSPQQRSPDHPLHPSVSSTTPDYLPAGQRRTLVRPRGMRCVPIAASRNMHPRVSSSTRRAARPAPISPDGTSFHRCLFARNTHRSVAFSTTQSSPSHTPNPPPRAQIPRRSPREP